MNILVFSCGILRVSRTQGLLYIKNLAGVRYKPGSFLKGSSPPFDLPFCLIAELQRAKRASEAPWVRKIGNPSSRENLVMTSAYERPYVRTDSGGGEGRLTVTHTGN